MGRQQDVLEAALERDGDNDVVSLRQVIMGVNGPVDTSRRIYVDVWDVEQNLLRQIPVPFGIPNALGFGLMMLERYHPELRVVESQPHNETENAAVLVVDRGPT